MGDLFFTLSPVYRIGCIFGIAMFKPKKSYKKNTSFTDCKFSIIYGEIVIIFEMVLHIFLFSFILYIPWIDIIQLLAFLSQEIVGFTYLASCGYTNYYFSKTYVSILNQLIIIDKKIKNVSINYKIGFKFSLIFMLLNTMNSIFFIIFLYAINGHEMSYKYLHVISDILLVFIIGMSLLQFLILVIILNERFDCLQKNLNQVISKSKKFKFNNKNIIFETSYLHRSLCNIILKINSIYGFQLLIYITLAFISIMSYVYDICDTILREAQNLNDIAVGPHVVSLLWICYFIVELICLCTICGKLPKKVSETSNWTKICYYCLCNSRHWK